MANVTHIAAGLSPKRDGTNATGDNVTLISAGLSPAISSGTPSTSLKVNSISAWAKINGIDPGKINGVANA